ncbi:MAG: hypothetical protein J0L74_11700 [Burkholderiales bacterium]|nr:hypothetical protein [Burkholderiales bacterium]
MTDLLSLYRTMVRIRAFEDAAEAASQGGVSAFGQSATAQPARVRGPLHLSTGQEAVAAGVCAHLKPADLLTSTHRGHGHTLAKGADPTRMMCELFGKASGYNGGKGGSMHIADFSVGMLGANGVVAAGLPIAVGAAQGLKLRGQDAIAVCFFGDGAINRGPFMEALNWAVVYQLPVLFVCEDNRISATTESGKMTAGPGASARAAAMGIAAVQVDGTDVQAVSDAAATLIGDIRTIYDNYDFKTQILAASIRTANHVKDCAMIGADVITAPPAVIKGLASHVLTDKGLEQFLKDWAKTGQKIL